MSCRRRIGRSASGRCRPSTKLAQPTCRTRAHCRCARRPDVTWPAERGQGSTAAKPCPTATPICAPELARPIPDPFLHAVPHASPHASTAALHLRAVLLRAPCPPIHILQDWPHCAERRFHSSRYSLFLAHVPTHRSIGHRRITIEE